MVERHAVVRLDDKLLLEPELLLEILQLLKEGDYLVGDTPYRFGLAEIVLDARGRLRFDVVQMHDLILDIEIKLAAQEAAEVFVCEIVECVAAGLIGQMLFQQRAVWVLLRRSVRPERL